MTRDLSQVDKNISNLITIIEQLIAEDYEIDFSEALPPPFNRLQQPLRNLAAALKQHDLEVETLTGITSSVNAGLLLDEILEMVYKNFRGIIPYNRIGFSLIDADGETIRAYWAKSDRPRQLNKDFAVKLKNTSLQKILQANHPRILNDLEEYLENKPNSISTSLIVSEGMRSSLTCPLIVDNTPIGFMFFSSIEKGTYKNVHVNIFAQIAGQLSVILEKGRLVSKLTTQKTKIEQQNKELVKLNELKNTFLGIAAHDMRGPIGNIQMITDLMLDGFIELHEDERTGLIKDIGRQSTHMLSLLNDLLDVTRIETGKLVLNFEEFEINPFILPIIARHAMAASVKNTKIELAGPIPTGLVKADIGRLQQVVDNLISNAVKYSPAGSLIEVGTKLTHDGWKFCVKDQGPGITTQDRKHLFQDFAKLSAKPTGGEKSVGLGLAISRRIIEAHGGSIGVDSEAGKGAEFWFILPN